MPHRINLSHCCYQNNPKASLHGTTGHSPDPQSLRTCNCNDISWLLVAHQNTPFPSFIQHSYAEIHSPFKKCIQRNNFPTNKQEEKWDVFQVFLVMTNNKSFHSSGHIFHGKKNVLPSLTPFQLTVIYDQVLSN